MERLIEYEKKLAETIREWGEDALLYSAVTPTRSGSETAEPITEQGNEELVQRAQEDLNKLLAGNSHENKR